MIPLASAGSISAVNVVLFPDTSQVVVTFGVIRGVSTVKLNASALDDL